MKNLTFLFTLFFALGIKAQERKIFTLKQLLDASESHEPSAKLQPLIQSANDAATSQLRKNYLPQASLNAQATWQTEVTQVSIPLPGIEVPLLDQDQYRITLELAQPIWDGGQTRQQINFQDAKSAAAQQQVLVERYPVREQVVQMTCAVLLAEKQSAALEVQRRELELRRERLAEQTRNGTAIEANVLSFEARLLELEQQFAELSARKSAALEGLRLLTGLKMQPSDSLEVPSLVANLEGSKNRPELSLFSLQQQSLLAQEGLSQSKLHPRLNAIGTLGYGRPGLNFLSNDFEPYAIVGLNLRWNLAAFYANSDERTQLQLQRMQIDARREQFQLQTAVRRNQFVKEIERLMQVLAQDEAIIELRESIAATAAVQLENGTITPGEYLIESGYISTARLNAALHEVQMLLAQWLLAFNEGSM